MATHEFIWLIMYNFGIFDSDKIYYAKLLHNHRSTQVHKWTNGQVSVWMEFISIWTLVSMLLAILINICTCQDCFVLYQYKYNIMTLIHNQDLNG